jgi:hypothetical protein
MLLLVLVGATSNISAAKADGIAAQKVRSILPVLL